MDITALRSFVAVTAFGGVRRAAEALHLSPATISADIRRLERELGCRLVIAQGRGIGLTADGEELATHARAILQQHDDAIQALRGPRDDTLVVAVTEMAAEFLLPQVVSALSTAYPHHQVQVRLSRSERVRQLAEDARADVGLMLTHTSPGGVTVAPLPLQWFGTHDAPRDRIVVFSRPCAVRDQAIAALRSHPHEVVKDGPDLLCVLTAARDGLGVTPLPRIGSSPDGLEPVEELPAIPSVIVHMTNSRRINRAARTAVADAVRHALR